MAVNNLARRNATNLGATKMFLISVTFAPRNEGFFRALPEMEVERHFETQPAAPRRTALGQIKPFIIYSAGDCYGA